uniref:Fibronectin type-III domain-containing protein n=1 Tax=Sphenodon punctatus TaxID=8508 RepID=A0A8D0H0V6_SPHPU
MISYFLNGELQYELHYRRRGDSWQDPHSECLSTDAHSLWLTPTKLQGDADYEFQVRAKPRSGSAYQGVWSEWSSPLILRSQPAAPESKELGWLAPLLALSLVATTIA